MKTEKKKVNIFIALLIIIGFSVKSLPVIAQEDKDPEIMNAMIDSKATSAQLNNQQMMGVDPLEQAINQPTANSKVQPKKNEVIVNTKEETPKKVEKKKKEKKQDEVIKLTAEESSMLKKLDTENKKDSKQEGLIVNRKPIYVPAPVEQKSLEDTIVERDSSKIITRTLGSNDILNVEMCMSSGLTVMLDKSIEGELTMIRADEPDFIAVSELSKRGAFIHLKRDPGNQMFESPVRFEQDAKTYLINIIAVGCPAKGLTPFPKVIYLKSRPKMDSRDKMTPEDTIIHHSKGLPRIQKNRIRIYDMLMDAGSDWAIFGVEVQLPSTISTDKMKLPKMIVLDNLQISNLNDNTSGLGKVAWEYLPLQSQKASELRGTITMRYKLTVPINKSYILKRRYLHLMYLDEEGGYYQYIRVDTMPYFYSLLKRGLEL